jgi:hypothetical protein
MSVIVREAVSSSHIAEVGYDAETGTIEILYVPSKKEPGGAVWRYRSFTQDEYDSFRAAPSLGSALYALRQRTDVLGEHVVEETA